MQVKVANHQHQPEKPQSSKRLRFIKLQPLLLIVLVVSLIIAIDIITIDDIRNWMRRRGIEEVGYMVLNTGYYAMRKDVGPLQSVSQVPTRIFKALNAPDIPTLVIDIKFKHWQKIAKKRAEALARKVLVQGSNEYVPATIRYSNQTTKVKLRLKGDGLDHLRGNKWSFRIHVKGKNHIFGLRRFSIQNPRTRGFQGEVLFLETVRYMGVLAPRYFFVNVIINGDSKGIMAVEEHFSKELLEASGRREGVIVRFDESWIWAIAKNSLDIDNIFNNYKNVLIDVFHFSRIAKSEKLSKDYAIAVGLLRSFVNGTLLASEVFDVEQMGRFLSVAELWGNGHSIGWNNQRYYLNPLTLKLEPIGYDASIHDSSVVIMANEQRSSNLGEPVIQNVPMIATMFKDPKILAAYNKSLTYLANEIINGNLLNKLKEIEQQHLPALHKEFFLLDEFSADRLLARAKALLEPATTNSGPVDTPDSAILLHANRIQSAQGPYLELASALPRAVEVQTIQWLPKDKTPNLVFEPITAIKWPIELSPTPLKALPKYQHIYYKPPSEPAHYTLQVSAKVIGAKNVHKIKAQKYYAPLTKHPIQASSQKELLAQNAFLSIDAKKQTVSVKPGQWQVNGPLNLPEGFSLTIPAGTILQFNQKEGLIARGSLHFQGTKEEPIVLEGIEKATWQGLVVLNANKPSEWSYVTVNNTTGINRNGWELTGGVNFYQNDIQLNHCVLQGNKGEDALNIVHAKFNLKDVQIIDTASDGFDADFSEGTVEGGLFQNIGMAGGGDGIDISGSTVKINGTRFQQINDKALSVGERSKMTATNVTITHAGTGAASKDASHLNISNSTIAQIQNAALMAYTKKPEFGVGNIEAHNLTFGDNTTQARSQKGSTIKIDGKLQASEDVDVEQLYETTMKPGLRQ